MDKVIYTIGYSGFLKDEFLKTLKKADFKRGSAIVEAAIIFPIIILLSVLVMIKGIAYKEQVADKAIEDKGFTKEKVEDLDFFTETELRAKWKVKEAFR